MAGSKASYDEVETAFLAVNSETEAWLDTWFSDEAQRRLRDAVDRLAASRAKS